MSGFTQPHWHRALFWKNSVKAKKNNHWPFHGRRVSILGLDHFGIGTRGYVWCGSLGAAERSRFFSHDDASERSPRSLRLTKTSPLSLGPSGVSLVSAVHNPTGGQPSSGPIGIRQANRRSKRKRVGSKTRGCAGGKGFGGGGPLALGGHHRQRWERDPADLGDQSMGGVQSWMGPWR